LEIQSRRGAETSKLQSRDEKIAASRVLATFSHKDSCPHMLEKFNDARIDPKNGLDVILQ
jgi:hypothetical protein